MESTSVKEQILKSIRESLIEKDEEVISDKFEIIPEVKPNLDEFPDLVFAQKFSEKGGDFHLCTNGKELVNKISSFFHEKKLNTIFCNHNDLGELLEVCGVTAYDKTLITTPYDYMVMPVDFLISETGGLIITSKTSAMENILETNCFVFILL
ncbi:MAG: hypothetical protein EOM76_11315 [Sphingobacteriia bacterium]|nr:hypothetical protein [Sphingobacteriia bacterium]